MKKVAVITDSNSGITQSEAKKLGIHVVPMPFFVNGDTFYEDTLHHIILLLNFVFVKQPVFLYHSFNSPKNGFIQTEQKSGSRCSKQQVKRKS